MCCSIKISLDGTLASIQGCVVKISILFFSQANLLSDVSKLFKFLSEDLFHFSIFIIRIPN